MYSMLFISFLCLQGILAKSAKMLPIDKVLPELEMTTPEIIHFMGYPSETHSVTTTDGYLLELHRIPLRSSGKPPVLLQHGISGSSTDFVLNYPDQSLPYILFDAGFEVWLGNFRGNIYSNKHLIYNNSDPLYWNFSAEQVLYDGANVIDYILNATGHGQLYYVGHSLGSVGLLALLSRRPEYNSKVKYIVALAPTMNTRYVKGMFAVAAQLANINGIPQYEQDPVPTQHLKSDRRMIAEFCWGDRVLMCNMALEAIFGPFSRNTNMTRMPLYVLSFLSGGEIRQITQVAHQVMVEHDIIREFDYGPRENLRRYGQDRPRGYDFNKVTSPVFIYYSDGDFLSAINDIKYMSQVLGNFQGSHLMEEIVYSHVDYLIATNNKDILHDKIVARFNEFEARQANHC